MSSSTPPSDPHKGAPPQTAAADRYTQPAAAGHVDMTGGDRDDAGSDAPDAGGREKAKDAYRTISEVADLLDLPQHVLRFWEGKFPQIKPLKRSGNRRYYRRRDIDILDAIKKLLHEDGFTIRGVQKQFKDHGLQTVVDQALGRRAPGGDADTLADQQADTDPRHAAQRATDGAVPTPAAAPPEDMVKQLKSVLKRLKAARAALSEEAD